jgi:hypothetical protein
MAFPPASGSKKSVSQPANVVSVGAASTGNGGIKTSLKVKAAGTKNTQGVEKTVNLF